MVVSNIALSHKLEDIYVDSKKYIHYRRYLLLYKSHHVLNIKHTSMYLYILNTTTLVITYSFFFFPLTRLASCRGAIPMRASIATQSQVRIIFTTQRSSSRAIGGRSRLERSSRGALLRKNVR